VTRAAVKSTSSSCTKVNTSSFCFM
jgi:hypothetical protein